MKIEMGESLFYSWLRHVKECQIVQTNWKISPKWQMQHEEEIYGLMSKFDEYFARNYGYSIFKKNSSMGQVILQGECDVIGVSFAEGKTDYYAVDVAFHEAGLNYGSKEDTVMKVISKTVRTAMCLYSYMDTKEADIVFASPKINPAVMRDLLPCIRDINNLFRLEGYSFCVRLIANKQFEEQVLAPIMLVSNGVADTSELFMRSYQMYKMFAESEMPIKRSRTSSTSKTVNQEQMGESAYGELKIGQLVRTVLLPLIVEKATDTEIEGMQDAEYSKNNFGLNYPLLLKTNSAKKELRYYKELIEIRGTTYRLCSEWFETEANNDRPYVEKWIERYRNIS